MASLKETGRREGRRAECGDDSEVTALLSFKIESVERANQCANSRCYKTGVCSYKKLKGKKVSVGFICHRKVDFEHNVPLT